MKHVLVLLFCLAVYTQASAQRYQDTLYKYRENYKNEFLHDERSPLTAQDTGYLRFYAPDATYRVIAALTITPKATPFSIPTHSGKSKIYRKYGYLTFRLKGEQMELEVYQSPDLMKNEQYKDYLFIPFNDLTNYEETYGGGRYLDLSLKEIQDNKVVLDFNKCYNPYCAYASGYNCPIPPEANRLPVAIKAGEKMYAKKIEE